MTNGNRTLNYVTTNRFYIEVGGTIAAEFTECSGISVQVKKEVYFEGGVNEQQRIRLGHAEFADVTLKRGITDNMGFWEWTSQVFTEGTNQGGGKTSRHNVNILVFDQSGKIMQSWTLIGAVPVAWKVPALQASGNTVVIEELTLAYEGLKVGNTSGGGREALVRSNSYFPSA
ncbi:phage tail protein [Oculatella sp. LEGE 06141]|uniref:phage tail protein n=1 Tax=Oculatella sp. LEGE 06141 TaxID=1828648 RepID=UPI00187F29EA|nr:phage tail protein [Oculatella sp. LEGE 06141]MBE9182826.1 phage tail protein [Oculatella sp. LEGE 06141]